MQDYVPYITLILIFTETSLLVTAIKVNHPRDIFISVLCFTLLFLPTLGFVLSLLR